MSVKLRTKKLQGGNKSLYLDIYLGGKRTTKFLGLYLTNSRAENAKILEVAHQVRVQTELDIQSKKYGIKAVKADQTILSLGLEVASKKNHTTQKLYRLMLNHLDKYAGKDLLIRSITPLIAEEFRDHLARSMKASSASCFYGKFKSLLKLAVRNEIIQRNPAEGIGIKGQESQLRYLTLEEVKRLSSTPTNNQQVRNAFLFGIMTGLRWGDISRLLWSDIIDGMIHLKQQKVQRLVAIPLSRHAISLLEHQRLTPISPWQDAKKYQPEQIFKLPTTNIVRHVLYQWAKQADIQKRISPHWARHTFACLLINSGADPYVISNLMGHSKIGITLHYAKLLNPRKVEVISHFPQIMEEDITPQ